MGESRVAQADRRAAVLVTRLGAELRDARLAASLTLQVVADRIGISASELSRVERGAAPWVSVGTLSRIGAVVGLDLWVRLYPGPDALRDASHLRLQTATVRMIGSGLQIRTEVPLGDPRDQRAWDMTLGEEAGRRAGVEFDTRLVDAQSYLRRVALKRRDGAVELVILVLADTRANRAAVAAARAVIAPGYSIDDPEARAHLRAGRLPSRDAMLFVRVGAAEARAGAAPERGPGVRRERSTPPLPGPVAAPVGK